MGDIFWYVHLPCLSQMKFGNDSGPYGFILFQYELIWRHMDSLHDLLAISEYTPVPLSHGYLWDLLARVYQLVSKWFGNNFPELPIRGCQKCFVIHIYDNICISMYIYMYTTEPDGAFWGNSFGTRLGIFLSSWRVLRSWRRLLEQRRLLIYKWPCGALLRL